MNPYFKTLCIDNLIQDDIYIKLVNSFPNISICREFLDPGIKYNLNESYDNFKTFLNENKEWLNFYNFCKSKKFVTFWFKKLNLELRSFRSKFEFSKLPSNGGCVYPHPDTPKKIITIVMMFPENNWKQEWGGSFQTYSHKEHPEKDLSYWRENNWNNVNILEDFKFIPNRAVAMHRTPKGNSLHGVMPCNGPEGYFRNTVTFNIIGDILPND